VATKAEALDVEEVLDYIDKTMERLKSLYEQFFLGLQKQAPAHLHNDVERRIRELMQVQIRNTGLRYRYATLQQKFGSYNSYWRRTLRQIEQGTYIRQLAKISRKAAETGDDIPEEILAAMPKRMREQVKRDREQALAVRARHRRDATESDTGGDEAEGPSDVNASGEISVIGESQVVRNAIRKNQHQLSETDGDMDFEAFFASVSDDTNPDAKAFPSLDDDDEPTGFTAPPKPAPARAPQPVQRAAVPAAPPQRQTQPIATQPQPPQRQSQPIATQPQPPQRQSQPPATPPQRQSQPMQAMPPPPPPHPVAGVRFVAPQRAGTQPGVAAPPPPPPSRTTGPMPVVPPQRQSQPIPVAPSQVTRPNPVAPGSSQQRPNLPVQSMQGPFPRAPRPEPAPPMRPPPGMNDADVNALYAKYVKAKQAVGEDAGPGAYGKLLKTINSQAPKIMEQYKAKGVEFSVVVKDNQVIIKAKPKP
jgi:hypothetical protein